MIQLIRLKNKLIASEKKDILVQKGYGNSYLVTRNVLFILITDCVFTVNFVAVD